jgi:hypothetical protein
MEPMTMWKFKEQSVYITDMEFPLNKECVLEYWKG